jgi:hypothetical protein
MFSVDERLLEVFSAEDSSLPDALADPFGIGRMQILLSTITVPKRIRGHESLTLGVADKYNPQGDISESSLSMVVLENTGWRQLRA